MIYLKIINSPFGSSYNELPRPCYTFMVSLLFIIALRGSQPHKLNVKVKVDIELIITSLSFTEANK